ETIAVATAEPDGEVRSLETIANRSESICKLDIFCTFDLPWCCGGWYQREERDLQGDYRKRTLYHSGRFPLWRLFQGGCGFLRLYSAPVHRFPTASLCETAARGQ